MDKFTDEDLKRLNRHLEGGYGAVSGEALKALLARLEVSEKLVENLLTFVPHEDRPARLDDLIYRWQDIRGQ